MKIDVVKIFGLQVLKIQLAELYVQGARRHDRLKNLAGDNITLAVSSEGLRTIEEPSGEIVKSVPIEDISFVFSGKGKSKRKKTEHASYSCI
jgi:hypothetical protein